MDHFLTRAIGSIMGLGLAIVAIAQEHPYIASYTLTEFDGSIRIAWVIQSGSTCNGQDVERSTDGVTFTKVHRIEGICGDPSVAVPFNWFDQAPPEFSTIYYRIKLGLDGYTSIKSVVFDQLTTSEQRFFPSPMGGEATLVLHIGSVATFDLRIWNSGGDLVYERLAVNGPSVRISMPDEAAGVYLYQAESDGRLFFGRFVKA